MPQEYGYLKCALMQLPTLGVQDSAVRPLSACAACDGAAGVHINVDFNFSLSHFARCGTSDVRLSPPNSLHFLRGGVVDDHLLVSGGAAAAAPTDTPACSDFDAARVLGRTSQSVRGCRACTLSVWCFRPAGLWCCAARGPSNLFLHYPSQHDITAVGVTMCRHSVVAHALDIGTGERYIYAAIMLYMLMVGGGEERGDWMGRG